MRLPATTVMLLSAPLLVLPAAAQAQVIDACVNKNGSMRIVNDLAECKTSETTLSWNQTGPQGEPGGPGPQGEPGDPEGALQQQLDALQAESDRVSIVVDGNGKILGPERGSNTNFQTAVVQFDLPDLPIFFLQVTRNEIEVSGVGLWFESTDCTGQAWMDAGVATSGITAQVRALTPVETGIRTFYVADPLATPETISRRSQNGGVCEAIVDQIDAVQATSVDLDAMFMPPFRVTTRERM